MTWDWFKLTTVALIVVGGVVLAVIFGIKTALVMVVALWWSGFELFALIAGPPREGE